MLVLGGKCYSVRCANCVLPPFVLDAAPETMGSKQPFAAGSSNYLYADEASIRQDRIKVSFYEIGCSPLSWTLSPSADLLFRAQIVDPVEN